MPVCAIAGGDEQQQRSNDELDPAQPAMPRPISQPRAKAGPLTLARRLVSMSTTVMIGMGLSAIPAASGSDLPMDSPIYPSLPRFARTTRAIEPGSTGESGAPGISTSSR